jgi:FkbM family methyltransferase
MSNYYSQWGQDRFINENIFKGKKGGVFVDIGAHDGVTLSNTLFFEKELGWSGLCIEPIVERYCELVKARNCICMNCCVYSKNAPVFFRQNSGYTEMLSGISDTCDVRHLSRMSQEQKAFGGESRTIKKQAYTLSTLLSINNIEKIDYLSIDTEGSEYEILLGMDFKKFPTSVVDIECNYEDTFSKVNNLMLENGFEKIAVLGGDWVYIRK